MTNSKIIEVLGPGCGRCREAYRVVQQALAEAGSDYQVVKNESVERMAELGLLATPGLAIGGRLVFSGRVPRVSEVRALLESTPRD